MKRKVNVKVKVKGNVRVQVKANADMDVKTKLKINLKVKVKVNVNVRGKQLAGLPDAGPAAGGGVAVLGPRSGSADTLSSNAPREAGARTLPRARGSTRCVSRSLWTNSLWHSS